MLYLFVFGLGSGLRGVSEDVERDEEWDGLERRTESGRTSEVERDEEGSETKGEVGRVFFSKIFRERERLGTGRETKGWNGGNGVRSS